MSDIAFVEAWRKNDPKLEADARAFWIREDAMPDENVAERIKQLAVMAYEGGELVAITTIHVREFTRLRQKFAFLRGMVAKDHREQHLAIIMGKPVHDLIEKHAIAHPEENIAGLAAVVSSPLLGARPNPYPNGAGLVLIGYTPYGEQVRVSWFDHFRVPANLSETFEQAQIRMQG
ncbi:MAG: hypothetical protein Q7S99_05430 [Parvibaculum sp.]|nr:hypothetical protein [Parvibaculum sp.]|tara:strand:- start:1321 stop:1848 length:528 start_codon:yes stop_codon:yes gene_type:complete